MSSFDVKFSEQSQSFGAAFGENKPSFGAGFGEVNIIHGKDGKSAYQIALDNGFEGSVDEWLDSLHGKTGETPDLQIGNVETLSAGSPATATIEGTKENPIINFGIPQGKDGYTPVKGKDYFDGKDGDPGYTPQKGKDYFDGKDGVTPEFEIGTVETLPSESKATVTVTGTDEKPVLNLGIPQGKNGDPGYTPQKGKDYWTDADKAEIKGYVDDAILGGAW